MRLNKGKAIELDEKETLAEITQSLYLNFNLNEFIHNKESNRVSL